MRIGERIKVLRLAQHMPITTLAKLSGAHPNTIHNVEKGKRAISWDMAERALKALGHSVLVVPTDANILVASDKERSI